MAKPVCAPKSKALSASEARSRTDSWDRTCTACSYSPTNQPSDIQQAALAQSAQADRCSGLINCTKSFITSSCGSAAVGLLETALSTTPQGQAAAAVITFAYLAYDLKYDPPSTAVDTQATFGNLFGLMAQSRYESVRTKKQVHQSFGGDLLGLEFLLRSKVP